MMMMLYFYIPRWKQPRKVNGILECYLLYISNHTPEFAIWDVIYNSSELFQAHVLRDLFPGNRYLIKLGVSSLYFYYCFCPHPFPCLFTSLCLNFSPSLKEKARPEASCIVFYTENSLHLLYGILLI